MCYRKMLYLILMYFVCLCDGKSILVVFPVPERTPSVLGDSVVNILLEADYEVTYVTPFSRESRSNLKYVDISSVLDQMLDQDHIKDNVPEDLFSPRFLPMLGTRIAQQALKHPEVQELMLNTSLSFDAVLVEWFYTGLFAPLAALFECPLIWYTPTDISWQSLNLVSSTPAHRLDLAPGSLAHRVHQIWSQLYLNVWNYLYFSRVEIPAYEQSYRGPFKVRRRPLPNYEAAVHDGCLLLVNSQPLLAPIVPVPPSVRYVGGHHLSEETPPLPKNLKKLMDSSEAGVIYVNVESNLLTRHVQEHVTQELKQAFSELGQTVVWKYDDILVNLPPNVYTVKNPPQRGILNHIHTIAFVNHGDMYSVIEATNYGVPLISIPLFEDQMANTNMMSKRGRGVQIGPKNLAWELRQSVKTLLSNESSYQINAKSAKATFRLYLATPQQELLHWVETVIRTGGALHLRSSNLTSTLEKYNVDIILLVLLSIWFCAKVVRLVRLHLDTSHDHEKDE